MNKIIPFEKKMKCDTDVYEITSISLEHDISFKEDKSISGEFFIKGTYKMMRTDTMDKEFSYTIPMDIMLGEEYDISDSSIEIDDFHYDIVDDDSILIHIDLLINNLKEVPMEEFQKDVEEILEEENRVPFEYVEEIEEDFKEDAQEDKSEQPSLFTKFLDDEDTYSTYKVYIVREQDTLESILEKYQVKREDLELYNDLEELHISDKIIIPYYEKN